MRMVITASSALVYGKMMHRGEEFDVPEKEALLWKALARAKPVVVGGNTAPETSDDIDILRGRYRTMTGRDPDMRWGVPRLQRETASPGTYGRRDMRAID